MNRFLQALLTGKLLRSGAVRIQLARLYSIFDEGTFCGLDVILYEPPVPAIGWFGHSGGAPGVRAISIWSPKDRAFVSVALSGEAPAEAIANLLLAALSKR